MVRMKQQIGVYEMALRLALRDRIGPFHEQVEQETARYIALAAVVVEAPIPD